MLSFSNSSIPALVLTGTLALGGCTMSQTPATSTSAEAKEVGAGQSEQIQNQLRVIEVLLVSQQEALAKGLTQDGGDYFYSYDAETKREVSAYPGEDPIIWRKGFGNSQISWLLSSAMANVGTYTEKDGEIKFTSQDELQGVAYTYRMTVKDGVVVSAEAQGQTSTWTYGLTDKAKETFAKAVSEEEAYPQEQYFEEPPPM